MGDQLTPEAVERRLADFLRGAERIPDNVPFTAGSAIAKRQLTFGDAKAILALIRADAKRIKELEGALEAFDMKEEDLVGAQGGHLIVRVPTSWFALRSAALNPTQERPA